MDMRGWLAVCDIQGLPSHRLSCGQLASGVWSTKYCVLAEQKLWILDESNVETFFSDSGNGMKPSASEEEEVFKQMEESFDATDASSDSRRRRQPSEVFPPNRDGIPNFLQRKIPPIRRSKSTKLSSGKENRPQDINALMAQGGPPKPEVELPFFMPAIESPDTLDLTSSPSDYDGAIVRPLHHSILGKDHCFEVVTHKGDSRCFGCDSAGEREAWIEKIKRTINPNLDNSRRIEHQLTLFVQEAKGLPTKKRYFCEICLDRKLCARTTSKLKNDSSVLWSEHFEFSSMPHIEDITVHLYKDSDK
uniref:PH domain-containing protein n=2 Tax=Ciona intestinalis TaxID=7719 RepID=F6QEI5_CIOIN